MGYKKILIGLIFILLIGCFFFNKKEKETTFTFWTIQLKAPVGDLIQKNIDLFQQKHPEIKIVWVDIPIAEAQKRTIASILGGNPPDLINLNPEFSSLLAQKNSLEYFNEEETKNYNQNLVNKLKYDKKIYALPFYATSAITLKNKEKFKNCNIQLKTYDDILKLKNCKNSPVFGIALNEGDSFGKILNKYNINFENLNEKELASIYLLFNQMKEEDLLLKDTLTINHREAIEKYMAESASFITAGSNFINIIKENAPDIYEKSEIIPQLIGNNSEYDVSIMNFIIPKKAKNKELAKEFAKLLLNKENQMELAKKTNVLPVNNEALDDNYFKNCGKKLEEQARCIAVKQLNSPIKKDFGHNNKKEINEIINKNLETLFYKGKDEFNSKNTIKEIENYIKN